MSDLFDQVYDRAQQRKQPTVADVVISNDGMSLNAPGPAEQITKLRAPLSQAEPQSIEQTVSDLIPTGTGLTSGAISATVGLPGDIIGIAKGLFGAAFPDADETSFEAFINDLSEISEKFGSEAVKGVFRDLAGKAGIEGEVFEDAMFAGEFGGVGGVIKNVPKIGKRVMDAAANYADTAIDRVLDNKGGVQLNSGLDVSAPVDEAIVAKKKAELKTRNDKGAERVKQLAIEDTSPEKKNDRPKIKHIHQYLDEFALGRHGRVLDENAPEDYSVALEDAKQEIKFQLLNPVSGKGWYDADIVKTFEIASAMDGLESLAFNETHRVIWSAIAGATSNGNNVPLNSKITTAQLKRYLRTGKLDTTPPPPGTTIEDIPNAGFGRRGPAVASGMKIVQHLLDKLGQEAFADWWLSPHSLGELNAVRAEAGVGKISNLGGGKDAMYLGARVLGDKTGQFSLNINGFDGTTKDVWFTRAYNRYFGTLGDVTKTDRYGEELTQPKNISQRENMNRFVKDLSNELKDLNLSEQDIQAIMWYYEQGLYTELGVRSIPESFSSGLEKLNVTSRNGVRGSNESEVAAQSGDALSNFRNATAKPRAVRADRRFTKLDSPTSGEDASGPYIIRSGGDDAEGRILEPNPTTVRNYEAAGLSAPVIKQVTSNDAQSYYDDMVDAMSDNQMGAQVEIKSVDDLTTYNLFRTEDGSGFAVKPDGDIVAVFKGRNAADGGGYAMLQAAVQMGGKKLDAFNTYLPAIYTTVGFRPVARVPWDEAQAPPGWDKKTFSKFQNGEPDVVMFVYDPDYFGQVDYTNIPIVSYDEAVSIQDEALTKLGGADG